MKILSEAGTDQPASTPLAETPDLHGAYPCLSDDQIAVLEAGGARRTVDTGDTLVREGERSDYFFVILSGKVAVIATDEAGDRHVIRVHGPGRFLGELGDLEGQAAFYTAEVVEPGEVLAIPNERVRALVAHDPVLSDLILRAYLLRRSLLIQDGSGFRIIGSSYDPDTVRLCEFAARNRLPHRWIDLERDKQAERLMQRFGISPQDAPVVIWGGDVLRNPSTAELARRVGLPVADTAPTECDVVVVGAGPAGLGAAVYGSSDGLITAALERIATGGQAGTSSRIENYLGFPGGISGADLAERAMLQAGKFGARITVAAEVTQLESDSGHHMLHLADHSTVIARAVVLATGARYRRLAVPGIEEFEGKCVYYAATYHEALMCGTGPVVIVGGGNSAGQAAVFLAERVSRVYLVIRGDDLNKDMSRYLVDRVSQHPRVKVRLCTEVREVHGDHSLTEVVVEDNRTGERQSLPARALFVFIGAVPNTAWLAGAIKLDDHGFAATGAAALYTDIDSKNGQRSRRPMMLETSRPGVFAAGDVRSGSVKRVASAVGEGSMAIRQIHEYFGT
ncbi:cyclic nucleotide-binding domain-containing thioredoxin-disulfide reductase [Mycobacterium sp. 236(2023)]|uniref:FAD-dependent oxidoreductase n=1 Tax=Mycobacterium sp. 236(2023) TaxID=3038163 RepID=UPI0024155818|nr:cyclic nucleotide-binding domain-containing thioredoxin-disulfide reductase [Mycobacterium sp. 236(2023)]MDG4667199.1 FAD-dependent oxidoreductase [Mycobacterium sp. 236(2023)]